MTAISSLRTQIERALDHLSPRQLARLWEYLQTLQHEPEPQPSLYSLHEQAIATGISDLAEHHDRYLYDPDHA